MSAQTETLRVFPFRYKLTLLIALIVVIVLAAILAVSERYIEDEFRLMVLEQLGQTDRYVGETLEGRFELLQSSTRLLSDDKLVLDILTDPGLSDLTRSDIVVEEIAPALGAVDLLAVLDDDGEVLGHNAGWSEAVTRVFDQVRATSWFPELLAGRSASGTVFLAGDYHQVVGMPVFIGDEMAGIVIASRAFTEETLGAVKEATGADIAILRDGRVFLSTFGTLTEDAGRLAGYHAGLDDWLASGPGAAAEAGPGAATGDGAAAEARLLDERYLLRRVDDAEGLAPPYVVAQSLDRRLEFLKGLRLSTLGIGALGVGIGVALGFVMALAVSRPIRSLRHATREVERDNLDHRVSIHTRDEFAELGSAFNRMIEGLEEKRRIRAALDKSVSHEVAEHILGSDAQLGGERRRATILFSDIRGFAELAERLPAEQLISLLNAYYTRVNACIEAHRGITDKYIGDAVMALFGIPVAREQHALDAVRTAQDLVGALRVFNREVASGYGLTVETGIGINTGDVVAGLVGSEDRLAYTAVGDETNLSSRLEGLCRHYDAQIILGEASVQELESTSPEALADLPIRELDQVRVKGRKAPVRVYELLVRPLSVAELAPQLSFFQEARQCLLRRDFAGARSSLEAVLAAWSEDRAARALLARCEAYAADPALFDREYHEGIRIFTSK